MSVAATVAHVPAVRFNGFFGDWEQRKFEELYKKYGKKNDLSYGENEIISVANMYYKTNSYISDKSYLLTYNIFELGDIAYEGNRSKDFVYGRFVENTIGNGIVSHVFQVFRPIMSRYDLSFWKYAINNENLMRSVLSKSTKSSTMMTDLVADDFLKEYFAVPRYEEQVLIGRTLSDIDNLIALQQQKYEKLQNVKKAMLAQMFPAPGATTPAVRFAGFTAPWQQSGLSDLCVKFIDGDWIESKDQSDTGVRLVQTGNVGVTEFIDKPDNMKWVSYDTFERLHCEEVLPGDILISRLPEPAGRACIVPSLGSRMITAVDCTIVRTSNQCDNGFLIQYLSSQEYFDQVNTELAGGTRQRIGRSNLASFKVPIPTSYEEQVQIGEYFQHLDNLISLHRRKLEKLQNVKKACLEGMFV
jgi:type I restriction enzyme S subunit